MAFKVKQKTSKVITMPAPIGGWNVFDPLPKMKPTDAVILDNFFCLPSQIMIRKGYTVWGKTLAGTVKSIFNYAPQSGTEKIFCVSDNSGTCQIYDITTQGADGTVVVAALTSAVYKTALFSNSAGVWLFCVNGADNLQLFDGTTWTSVTSVSAHAITGLATTSLIDVIQHKNRAWFVQKNSLSCWYLAVSAISGALTEFPMGALFKHGGYIVKINTWTLDAGYGVDDHFCIFTSKGEVAVYRGTDPSQASTWALVGVFYIGSPTGSGKTCKYGGDLLIINKDGIAQMSKSLMSSRVSTLLTLTAKIQPQLADDTTNYAALTAWDMLLYPPENMFLVNVPYASNLAYQYVMNTISGAWSRWTNIPAQCWGFASETLLFGGLNNVYKMWDTQNDNGAAITATMLPAFNNFGDEGRLKRWNMARVIYGYTSSVSVGLAMAADFNLTAQSPLLSAPPIVNVFTWGVSTWGDGSVWGGALFPDRNWKSVIGFGYWGALQIQFQTIVSDIRVYSIDYNVEGGAAF